jgi:hypothetical protein
MQEYQKWLFYEMAEGKRNVFHPEQVLCQDSWSVIYTLQAVIVVRIVINLGIRRLDRLPKLKALVM